MLPHTEKAYIPYYFAVVIKWCHKTNTKNLTNITILVTKGQLKCISKRDQSDIFRKKNKKNTYQRRLTFKVMSLKSGVRVCWDRSVSYLFVIAIYWLLFSFFLCAVSADNDHENVSDNLFLFPYKKIFLVFQDVIEICLQCVFAKGLEDVFLRRLL